MTDTQVAEGTEAEQTAAPTEKPAKVVKEAHACLCQTYELVGDGDDEVYQTECGQTTKGTFAQGHDARLVSFLVDGHKDGYKIRQTVGDVATWYNSPAEAVAHVSEPLRDKAQKATDNMQARLKDKADKAATREAKKAERAAAKEAAKAAKAAEPKNTGAEVVAGSVTGDVAPLADGQVRIKVGRWEYVATKLDNGGVSFVNGKGETETRDAGDGYTVLQEA